MEVFKNSQKFRAGTKHVPVPRVLSHGAYGTHRSSRYGYERHTELTEVPGTGMKVLQNSNKFWVLLQRRTELTEVPGRYKNAAPVPRALWPRAYRTYRSSGYGYECHAELTEVLCRVIPGQIPRIRFCMYPTYRTQRESFALVVGVHVAAVAFFAGNRCLVCAARGVRQAEALVLVVLLF